MPDDLCPLSQSSIIGPNCTAAGITEHWLGGSDDIQSELAVGSCTITNAIVCELNVYRAQNNYSWKATRRWICKLLRITDDQMPAIGTVQTQFVLLAKKRSSAVKIKIS